MVPDLTKEQREVGKKNFQAAAEDLSRRGFMKSAVVTAVGVPALATAAYFGYQSITGKPVKAALIGCGDEGGVLLGEHNPEFIEFIAACDIRPFNLKRIITGDPKVPLRKGFTKVYGEKRATEIGKSHLYTDYREMLQKEKDIEAVVVALPLHLHAPVAIECMRAGKHVLCEKLMARTVGQCKEMIKVAKETNRILSIGHQRHYSMLYANAVEVLQSGLIGDIKHIRALWHRNFSWNWAADPREPELAADVIQPYYRDGWTQPIFKMDLDSLKGKLGDLKSHQFGYKDIYELIRWRLYNRTGGGLMAELGSHQLDACSIFLGKVHPLAVMGTGVRSFFGAPDATPFRNNRSIDDHVFVTFEFPGKNHPKGQYRGTDKNDIVVVTYSSISTNGFEQYGECVMGSRGTMFVEGESNIELYKEKNPTAKAEGKPRDSAVAVKVVSAGKPVLEASSTWGPATSASDSSPASAGKTVPVSRGYREEMEDFAYCLRQWDDKIGYLKDDQGNYRQRLPRCHGEVAMADAILALSANLAMKNHSRIVFEDDWFQSDSPSAPDQGIKAEDIQD